ncbi:MAG: PEP-CTERM sorting domain-containing protein [Phycisphaerae bacterium]|nr:PEP-CTERM sorting domain-containing protein [Phycisphaerae bacterium]
MWLTDTSHYVVVGIADSDDYSGSNPSYMRTLVWDKTKTNYLYSHDNGTEVQRQEGSQTVIDTVDTWYTIKIIRDTTGAQRYYELQINGTTFLSETNSNAYTAPDDYLYFVVQNQGANAIGIDDVVVTSDVVPEPGTLVLLGLGSLGLLLRRRRR